jgi:hypothetical protein
MKIGLYNLQPKYINIALEKIRKYYIDRGDLVSDCSPVEAIEYDAVYCSSIFDWTSQKYVSPEMIKGGTGFDLTTHLPPEIDNVNIYKNIGFMTRGCIRNCKFCVVRTKEGYIRAVANLYDIWDRVSRKVIFLDNNALALMEHFSIICEQLRKEKVEADWNQGLDHRLLTPEAVDLMKSIRHHEYRFAFDSPKMIDSVDKAITLLQAQGINRCSWYVLCGFDTTFEEDLFRLNYLRERNQNAFVQRYRRAKPDERLTALARWANQHSIFQGMTWNQFLMHPDNKGYRRFAVN